MSLNLIAHKLDAQVRNRVKLLMCQTFAHVHRAKWSYLLRSCLWNTKLTDYNEDDREE